MHTHEIRPVRISFNTIAFPDDGAKLWRVYPLSHAGTVSAAIGIAVTAPGRQWHPMAMIPGDTANSLARAVGIARTAKHPKRKSPLSARWSQLYHSCVFVAIDQDGQEFPSTFGGTAMFATDRRKARVWLTCDGMGRLNKVPADTTNHAIITYFRSLAR